MPKLFSVFLFSAILILSINTIAKANGDFTVQLNNAYDNFKNGQYANAASIYETLIKVEKINNPYLYYNLSNSYYRLGEIGKAVLNIEKAYKLSPRDSDIKNNRSYLLTITGQKNDESISEALTGFFSLNEITVFDSIIFVLLLSAATLLFFWKKSFIKHSIIILSILFIVSIILTSLKASVIFSNKAIVLSHSVLKSGPQYNESDIYNMQAAQIVNIVSESDNWSRVNFKNSDSEIIDGWIENNKLGKY
jgi:tetratricopeptide (TPR) repeat protein